MDNQTMYLLGGGLGLAVLHRLGYLGRLAEWLKLLGKQLPAPAPGPGPGPGPVLPTLPGGDQLAHAVLQLLAQQLLAALTEQLRKQHAQQQALWAVLPANPAAPQAAQG